jgi:hypothetical protein
MDMHAALNSPHQYRTRRGGPAPSVPMAVCVVEPDGITTNTASSSSRRGRPINPPHPQDRPTPDTSRGGRRRSPTSPGAATADAAADGAPSPSASPAAAPLPTAAEHVVDLVAADGEVYSSEASAAAAAIVAVKAPRTERKQVRQAVVMHNHAAKQIVRRAIVVPPGVGAIIHALREKADPSTASSQRQSTGAASPDAQASLNEYGRPLSPAPLEPQQQSASKKRKRRKSLYRGVEPNGVTGWAAEIVAKGSVRHYLGTFATEEEAARAFDKKALELRGPKARLNFPDSAAAGAASAAGGDGGGSRTTAAARASRWLGVYVKKERSGGTDDGTPGPNHQPASFEARLHCALLRGMPDHRVRPSSSSTADATADATADGEAPAAGQGGGGSSNCSVTLGYFATELEAARAYDEVAGPLGRRTNGITWEQVAPILAARRDLDHAERLKDRGAAVGAAKTLEQTLKQLEAVKKESAEKIAKLKAKHKKSTDALKQQHKEALQRMRTRMQNKAASKKPQKAQGKKVGKAAAASKQKAASAALSDAGEVAAEAEAEAEPPSPPGASSTEGGGGDAAIAAILAARRQR